MAWLLVSLFTLGLNASVRAPSPCESLFGQRLRVELIEYLPERPIPGSSGFHIIFLLHPVDLIEFEKDQKAQTIPVVH